jgi:hypothetical protein
MKSLLSGQACWSDPSQEAHHKLWQAVLLMALRDLHGSPPSAFDCRRRQQEARRWFESPETGIGSLNWICNITNLDAGTVRRYALGAPSEIAPLITDRNLSGLPKHPK